MPQQLCDTVTICNMALRRIGQSKGIADFANDPSEAADACRLFFPQVLDEVLRAFNWPMATKFVSPALVAGPSPTATLEWACSYRYPSDALYIRRIVPAGLPITLNPAGYPFVPNYPSGRIETAYTRVPFRIVSDTQGLLILTDFPPVAAVVSNGVTLTPALPLIEYIFQQDAEQLYPADFGSAVAWGLAAELAPGITKGDKFKLGEKAQLKFFEALSRAQANAQNEQMPDQLVPEASWIDARN